MTKIFNVCARPASRMLPAMLLLGAAAGLSSQHSLAAGPIGCLIEPERTAELGSPSIGVIKSMLVERGDHVRKGQVIAVLRDDIERASLDVAHSRAVADAEVRAAQAGADLANQRRKRAIDLQAKGFIASQALEQTISETRVAEEKLLQAREQKRALEKESALAEVRLGERSIRSPFDGVIVERYFTAGERVEEKPMVRVARIDPLRVEVVMPSAMYGSVHAGTQARVIPDLAGMAPIAATVALVDKVLDAASSTYRVRLLLPNPTGSIPAGLRCHIEFAGLEGSTAPGSRKDLAKAAAGRTAPPSPTPLAAGKLQP
ncbi:MAG: efflux RND transporter periplasmic adaptor subunit [Janthinobacterium lividum]